MFCHFFSLLSNTWAGCFEQSSEFNLKTKHEKHSTRLHLISDSSFYSLALFSVILVIWTVLGANLSVEVWFCKGLKNSFRKE